MENQDQERATSSDGRVQRRSMDKNRHVSISPLNSGYVVQIGCQDFAFETVEKMINYLEIYLKDPKGTEDAWVMNQLNLD